MWGLRARSKAKRAERAAFIEAQLAEAHAATTRAQVVIDHVASHSDEVEERVSRLESRAIRNHFGDALTKAMERRTA